METKAVHIPGRQWPLDLSHPHFVGIGGAGMSALARILRGRGARVTGSDLRTTTAPARLETPGHRVLLGHACLTHKARMRVRDDLATMFCKRVATKIKRARAEPEATRLAEREIVEALIGNYRTVKIDHGGLAGRCCCTSGSAGTPR